MYPINQIFADYLKKRGRTWEVFIEVDGVTYGKDKIVDFTIESSLVPGSDFTIGAAIASKMTMTLKLIEDLPIGAKVVPYVTMSTEDLTWLEANFAWDSANFEWIGGSLEGVQLGEFYIDTRSKVNDNYSFVCLDRLILANSSYISQLDYPTTMDEVWNEICDFIGVENAPNVNIKPYVLDIAPTGYTMREVLGYIAAINCGSVFIGKDGKLNLRKFSAADNPVFDLDTGDYFRLKEINPTRTFTKIEVIYDVEDKVVYEAGEGDENATISIVNPLVATQEIVDDMLEELNGFSYLPLEIEARGFPQLELGDRLTVARQESTRWLDANTAWQDTTITWEGKTYHQTIITSLTYSFKGGLGTSIKSVSKSTQQSEFNSPKIIDQQIERQTKNNLKFGKPYYGVTHSRTEGIVVQREDGTAKAVFNADELSFWANGERSLWFDVPNEEWRFKGTIIASEMIGGIITGGVIYGANIRTNPASYPYVELSSDANVFLAAKSAMSFLEIEANPNSYTSPIIRHTDGTAMALTGLQGGDYFSLVTGGDYDIGANDGELRLTGGSIILNSNSGLITINSNISMPSSRSIILTSASNLLLGSTNLNSLLSSIYTRLSDLEDAVFT